MAPTAVEGTRQHLPIRILSRSLVKASDSSIKPYITSLNNLDLLSNHQLYMICLYPRHPVMRDFDDIITTFKTGLPTLLNYFYPLAGRIVTNSSLGLTELDYNNQGAELVVGEVDVSLGCLVEVDSLLKIQLPFPLDVPLSVQLMSFSDGGFAIVWGMNHCLNDGYSIAMVIGAWTEVAQSGKISKEVPNFDRSVFHARNPPLYSSEIEGMLALYDVHKIANVMAAQDSMVDRLYYIDASDLARLCKMASTEGQRASRIQALSAYIWKVLAAVVAASRVPDEHCRMGWWVNGRQRLMGMANYFGNITIYRWKKANVEEIQRKPLPDVATMVRETITAVDDAYIQEYISWIEQHRKEPLVNTGIVGLGPPTINLTEPALFDTDFGFGQAALVLPISLNIRSCAGFMAITPSPGTDRSWFILARVWPRLAEALESDVQNIFKHLTAEYVGL